jgi:ATP-binding cassette subfamily F protein 3
VYGQLAEEEVVYEKTRVNEENKKRQLEVFISRFKAKARLASQVQSKIKVLEKMGEKEQLEEVESLSFSFNSVPFVSAQMMSVNDVTFSYAGTEPFLIDNFSMNIGKKERICVIGKNGKGKSTLLKLLAGELYPVHGHTKTSQGLRTGYFGQPNIMRLRPDNTVLDEIMISSPACSLQAARNIAGMLMFKEDNALKPVEVLSGGEKNRVMLAKIVVTPCQLLLLDEPTNHLDMDSCDALLEAVDEFDGSVVMVTHNESFLKRIAKRLVVFDKDRVLLYEGGYEDFLQYVGWKDEIDAEAESGKVSLKPHPAAHAHAPAVKQEPVKTKGEISRERDLALKPITKEITKLEKTISDMEREILLTNDLLVKASYAGDSQKIIESSKRAARLKKEIEPVYDKLIKYTAEYEKLNADFIKKLSSV